MATRYTPDSTSRAEDRLLHLLGQQTLKISELETENKELQDKLSEALRARDHPVPSEVCSNASVEDFVTLRRAHDDLIREHAHCSRALEHANYKYENAKKTVMEWHAYVNKQLAKKSSDRWTSTRVQQSRATPTTDVSFARPPSPVSELRQPVQNNAQNTTSSQSTVCEPEIEVSAMPNPVDDEQPQVVSERQVKRRRIDKPKHSPRIKHEGVSVNSPFVILSDDQIETPVPSRRPETQMSDLNASIERRVVSTKDLAQSSKLANTSLYSTSNTRQHTPNGRQALRAIDGNIPSVNISVSPDRKFKSSDAQGDLSLRSRAVDTLQLQDFRPNPYYHGPTISFVDPVVSDTGRKCLPGCTRMACCGNKLRKMMEIGGVQITGLTDREALEEYLGSKYLEIMNMYTGEKRKDLVIQAHAMCFAQRSGVQSNRNIRPPTPPGFWRTDMPNTQELQEHKEQAQEQERRRIEERHHEALREGGRWLFRDET